MAATDGEKKSKALELALSQIHKQHGDGAVEMVAISGTNLNIYSGSGSLQCSIPVAANCTPAMLEDVDGDGRSCVEMYDYGIGDRIQLPVHLAVRRNDGGGFEYLGDVVGEIQVGALKRKVAPVAHWTALK